MLEHERNFDAVPPESVTGSMPPARILIVDDNENDLHLNAFVLKHGGHETYKTRSPKEARALAAELQPDVIVLDIDMPGMDGISLAYQLREDHCDAEIMFVTGFKELDSKVRGLAIGEQYLTKPFAPEEMLAMIGALVRRRRRSFSEPRARHGVEAGLPVFDQESGSVIVPHGRSNHLTPTERAVLRVLVEARGKPVSKTEILRTVWHDDQRNDTLVEVNIRRVRRKIELNPSAPELVLTAKGGYRYHVRD